MGMVRAGSSPIFTASRSQTVMILVVANKAGSSTRFVTSAVAMVTPESTPNCWIGTKLENANVRKPRKRATVA